MSVHFCCVSVDCCVSVFHNDPGSIHGLDGTMGRVADAGSGGANGRLFVWAPSKDTETKRNADINQVKPVGEAIYLHLSNIM